MDGSALKWNYYGPLDGLSEDEVKNLSVTDLHNEKMTAWKKMRGKWLQKYQKPLMTSLVQPGIT